MISKFRIKMNSRTDDSTVLDTVQLPVKNHLSLDVSSYGLY